MLISHVWKILVWGVLPLGAGRVDHACSWSGLSLITCPVKFCCSTFNSFCMVTCCKNLSYWFVHTAQDNSKSCGRIGIGAHPFGCGRDWPIMFSVFTLPNLAAMGMGWFWPCRSLPLVLMYCLAELDCSAAMSFPINHIEKFTSLGGLKILCGNTMCLKIGFLGCSGAESTPEIYWCGDKSPCVKFSSSSHNGWSMCKG